MRHPFQTRLLIFLVVASFAACTDENAPTSTGADVTAAEGYVQSKQAALPGIHPVEQQLYEYTSAYVMRIDAALAAADDNKTIDRLNTIKREMAAQTSALQLKLEPWLNALTEEERKAFRLRMMRQESISKNYQFLSDLKLGERIGNNPQLRAAFEKANEGAIQVWLPKETHSKAS